MKPWTFKPEELVADDSTSYPTMAAAIAFGIPPAVAYNFGWGIILNCREQEQNGWTRASGHALFQLIGFDRTKAFHDRLLAAYIAAGTVPPQEMPVDAA